MPSVYRNVQPLNTLAPRKTLGLAMLPLGAAGGAAIANSSDTLPEPTRKEVGEIEGLTRAGFVCLVGKGVPPTWGLNGAAGWRPQEARLR